MCGFICSVTEGSHTRQWCEALNSMAYRGPDDQGMWEDPSGRCRMGHLRLSILDLSDGGRQPMTDRSGRYHIVFNGEIYNYIELRKKLGIEARCKTMTDTEVLLAAYMHWGSACLDHLIGMFAFVIWDSKHQYLFAARDRFGVKPLYYHQDSDGTLLIASEIKAIHEAGVPRTPNLMTWATYLGYGVYDHGKNTFWDEIVSLSPGHFMEWLPLGKKIVLKQWYDIAKTVLELGQDTRDQVAVGNQLMELLEESVCLRFRSDVPVGVCLSGGLDSSLLLGLLLHIHGKDLDIKTFTFICGDEKYDEKPWVEQMLKGTQLKSFFCLLTAQEVPTLAKKIQDSQDEPFGGLPTLGMAKVHQQAKNEGVTVLLDGNGMDEGWAGYDYYQFPGRVNTATGPVQGARSKAVRPDCLRPEFLALSSEFRAPAPFKDALLDLQYRDICYMKIPRAMRFADRVSMMFSRELREPFLDHRILELGLRQPVHHKIVKGQGKWLPRMVANKLLRKGVREAPKRPVQTPQREWLKGPLSSWAEQCIETGLSGWGKDWLKPNAVKSAWREYKRGGWDNSFPIWQWLNLGLMVNR